MQGGLLGPWGEQISCPVHLCATNLCAMKADPSPQSPRSLCKTSCAIPVCERSTRLLWVVQSFLGHKLQIAGLVPRGNFLRSPSRGIPARWPLAQFPALHKAVVSLVALNHLRQYLVLQGGQVLCDKRQALGLQSVPCRLSGCFP